MGHSTVMLSAAIASLLPMRDRSFGFAQGDSGGADFIIRIIF